MKTDIDYLVCVSDLHCGSTYGLMPPEFTLADDNVVKANPFQRWLWGCWKEFWAWVDVETKGGKLGVAVVGDAIEGVHHGGAELVSLESVDHVRIAVDCLDPHIAGRKLFVIEGTECHTRRHENAIGDALDAVPYRAGVFCWPQLELEVRGCSGILRHHIVTASRPQNESSAFSLQLASDRIEAVRTRRKPLQFLVSAHRHRFGYYGDGDAMAVILPPWQGLTRHGRKVVPHAATVSGGVILDFRRAGRMDPPEMRFKRFVP